MNCPKCGKDMVSGFLQTGNLIAFNKTRRNCSGRGIFLSGFAEQEASEIPPM